MKVKKQLQAEENRSDVSLSKVKQGKVEKNKNFSIEQVEKLKKDLNSVNGKNKQKKKSDISSPAQNIDKKESSLVLSGEKKKKKKKRRNKKKSVENVTSQGQQGQNKQKSPLQNQKMNKSISVVPSPSVTKESDSDESSSVDDEEQQPSAKLPKQLNTNVKNVKQAQQNIQKKLKKQESDSDESDEEEEEEQLHSVKNKQASKSVDFNKLKTMKAKLKKSGSDEAVSDESSDDDDDDENEEPQMQNKLSVAKKVEPNKKAGKPSPQVTATKKPEKLEPGSDEDSEESDEEDDDDVIDEQTVTKKGKTAADDKNSDDDEDDDDGEEEEEEEEDDDEDDEGPSEEAVAKSNIEKCDGNVKGKVEKNKQESDFDTPPAKRFKESQSPGNDSFNKNEPTGPPYKVFLGNLPDNVTDLMIREAFSFVGNIITVEIQVRSRGLKPSGFAFMELEDEETMQKVIDLNNIVKLGDKATAIRKADIDRSGNRDRGESGGFHGRDRGRRSGSFHGSPGRGGRGGGGGGGGFYGGRGRGGFRGRRGGGSGDFRRGGFRGGRGGRGGDGGDREERSDSFRGQQATVLDE